MSKSQEHVSHYSLPQENVGLLFSGRLFGQHFHNCFVYRVESSADSQPRQKQEHNWIKSSRHPPRIDFVIFLRSYSFSVTWTKNLCAYRFTIGLCYSVSRGYALSSYLEYPFLVGQDILLLALVLHYSKQLGPFWFAAFGAYSAVVYALTTGLFPSALIVTLMVFNTLAILFQESHHVFCFRAFALRYRLPANWPNFEQCTPLKILNPSAF